MAARPFARRSERSANRMSRPRAVGRVEPAAVPDAPHRVADGRDVAEFPQRRQASGFRILATLDPFLDADGQVAANLVVEVALVGPHGLLLARRRRVHDASDRIHELRPAILLARQLRFPGRRQLVVLRPLVGLAHAPLGLQPAALHEAVQRGVERAGFDLQQVVGLRADGLADAVAVLRAPTAGSEGSSMSRVPWRSSRRCSSGRLAIVVDSLRL